MESQSARVRRAFGEASSYVLELADCVADDQWDSPAIGDWTLQELFVHTSRAASTITAYADTSVERTLMSGAEYYVAVLADPAIHDAVAQRTHSQAAEVDQTVPEFLASVFNDAENTLQRIPATAVMGTLGGGITLQDYLPTRVVELVVHGTDIAEVLAGLGVERIPAPPATALRVSLEAMVELSTRRHDVLDPVLLLRSVTGRATLPEGVNLLG